MKYLYVILFLLLSFYAHSQDDKKQISKKMPFDNKTIYSKVLQTLVLDGFSIGFTDVANGIITTEAKEIRLTKEQVDCGNFLGVKYAKDKRTFTDIKYQIFIKDSILTVNASITGEYKPGNMGISLGSSAMNVKKLRCKSLGLLETELIEKIK